MSIHSLEIDERKENLGMDYNTAAEMYRDAVKGRRYQVAKDMLSAMQKMDEDLAKEREP